LLSLHFLVKTMIAEDDFKFPTGSLEDDFFVFTIFKSILEMWLRASAFVWGCDFYTGGPYTYGDGTSHVAYIQCCHLRPRERQTARAGFVDL
jgi:hypothetical protein